MSIGAETASPPTLAVVPAAPPGSSAINALAIERELAWFEAVMQARISLHFEQPCAVAHIRELALPVLPAGSAYASLVEEGDFGMNERIVLMLALLPHVRPQVLDTLFVRNRNLDRGYTEFGGWKGRTHGGFLPTCETAVFLIAGEVASERFAAIRLFAEDHFFHRRGVLRAEHDAPGEPALSAMLQISPEYRDLLTLGLRHKPDFSSSFPARLITTPLSWIDLVLGYEVREEIDAIRTWMEQDLALRKHWQLGKVVKPGYRSLFFGPPGTGKTLTATLIGQVTQADVYRIDLSMVVSKFIGETEKNLARIFDQAQNRRWILFFDEADALFGKRTSTSSSNDRYANQEVSYLLQRVEDFPGLVILATNLKGNIDEAFARRFQSLVHFPMPDAGQRRELWEGMARHTGRFASGLDLKAIAEQHELSGGAIANVVLYGAIKALQAGRECIEAGDLLKGIAKEMRKEGRTV